MAVSVAAELDRRLAAAGAPGSPNALTAAEVRDLALEFLAVYDEAVPDYPAQPYWELWLADERGDDTLFAALLFHPDAGVDFVCGTGPAEAIRRFAEGKRSDDLDWVAAELSRRFTVPDGGLRLSSEAAEKWLNRGW
jgi:hypothetical protein